MEKMSAMREASPIRVFIADSNPLVQQTLIRLLKSESDIDVCGVAGNYEQLFRRLDSTAVDILILDLDGADMHGLELVRELTQKYPGLPILGISMRDETFYARQMIDAGGRGYLMKQDAANKMMEAIRTVLKIGIYLNDAVRRKMNVERR
ncbi:MAG TPA: response regulator transcription factor [Elusimicrobiota bacterium]|nr:response regulator transcription factor [Elusimicrobiota bacterium]